jgi:circadian clock protein KaiB
MEHYLLKLYVTGRSPRSDRALANLRRICADALGDGYDLEVVDVLEQPQQAERDRILVTPTLIRLAPPPPRRVLGDLSDSARVLWGLDLPPAPHAGLPGGQVTGAGATPQTGAQP